MNPFYFSSLAFQNQLRIIKRLTAFMNLTSLLIYFFVRLMVSDFTFSFWGELIMLLRIGFIGCASALLLYAAYAFITWIEKKLLTREKRNSLGSRAACLLAIFAGLGLVSCQAQVSGIQKDFNTGLTTSYKGLKPEEALLVMNEEVLGHTDIPLGESFVLINKGVKGFKEKDGKVSVGCSLTITDMKGKVLMKEADLFKGSDIFSRSGVEYLKCT
ncbi:MAG TPA: hypothetical protein VFR58_18770, partial [Flavisolibacter sp.]|nr:hypothetical protein [Flavisolibacter sp.]